MAIEQTFSQTAIGVILSAGLCRKDQRNRLVLCPESPDFYQPLFGSMCFHHFFHRMCLCRPVTFARHDVRKKKKNRFPYGTENKVKDYFDVSLDSELVNGRTSTPTARFSVTNVVFKYPAALYRTSEIFVLGLIVF